MAEHHTTMLGVVQPKMADVTSCSPAKQSEWLLLTQSLLSSKTPETVLRSRLVLYVIFVIILRKSATKNKR